MKTLASQNPEVRPMPGMPVDKPNQNSRDRMRSNVRMLSKEDLLLELTDVPKLRKNQLGFVVEHELLSMRPRQRRRLHKLSQNRHGTPVIHIGTVA